MRLGRSCKLEAKPELLVPQMLTSTAVGHTVYIVLWLKDKI
uniref:Uncharacterized protein n=1 Tax=Arundo donax TaxID=35708 RepID=A0A0A9E553_ARUDO